MGPEVRSISRSVYEQLQQPRFEARVLAVFDRACDLVTPDGDVIALVAPDIGDGPLNMVMEDMRGYFQSLAPGMTVTRQRTALQFGSARLDLARAAVWEPRPDWQALRAQLDMVAGRLAATEYFVRLGVRSASASASALERHDLGDHRLEFSAGWYGDSARLSEAAMKLAGLGRGLTPAGDDFLCGVMLWAWLAHPNSSAFCRVIAQTAAPRTTTLSAACLRAAARGECSAAWHRLFHALAVDPPSLPMAIRQVMACGATSGTDTLAGFVWMSQLPDWAASAGKADFTQQSS